MGVYATDTDCLYWAHTMFEAHHAAGHPGPWLRPSRRDLRPVDYGELPDVASAVTTRRRVLEHYVNTHVRPAEAADTSTRYDFDGYGCVGRLDARRYVTMAIGLTLDWIEHAFNPAWGQFLMMAPYHGDRLDLMWQRRHPDTPNAYAVLSGDSRQNTLRILTEAFEATRDRFYLDLFAAVWSRMTRNGPICSSYTAGDPDEPADAAQQAGFLGIVAQAARARRTTPAGPADATTSSTRPTASPRSLAKRSKPSPASDEAAVNTHPTPTGLRSSLLPGPLIRVRLTTPRPFTRIDIDDDTRGSTSTVTPPNHTAAVDEAIVYMHPGSYRIRTSSTAADHDSETRHEIAATTTWTAPADPAGTPASPSASTMSGCDHLARYVVSGITSPSRSGSQPSGP